MTRPRRSMRIAAAVVALGVLCAGLVLAFAPELGINRALGVAALLPARDALTLVALFALVVAAVASAFRAARPMAAPIGAALVVVLAATAPTLISRGLRNPAPVARQGGQLRILEWNTNGGLVAPSVIARLAAREKANIIVLPDADIAATAADYESAFTAAALPVRVFPAPVGDAQLAVLVAAPLAADFRASAAGPDPAKSLVLSPTREGLPAIVALHAPQPGLHTTSAWGAALDWVGARCSGGAVVAVGDFNASVDDFGSGRLGDCADVALARHSGSVGTWPTRLPAVVGMPIDHVLVTPRAGEVVSFSVLTDEDRSGARHRPTLTVLRPAH